MAPPVQFVKLMLHFSFIVIPTAQKNSCRPEGDLLHFSYLLSLTFLIRWVRWVIKSFTEISLHVYQVSLNCLVTLLFHHKKYHCSQMENFVNPAPSHTLIFSQPPLPSSPNQYQWHLHYKGHFGIYFYFLELELSQLRSFLSSCSETTGNISTEVQRTFVSKTFLKVQLPFLPPYTMPLMIHVSCMVTENCAWRKILKCWVWHVISKHFVWWPPDASQT